MRVASLVPSWTETLLSCGVEVVGRSRFCTHPAPHVSSIPVVGTTKELDLERLQACQPDLLLLDREENTREMADASPVAWHATHIRSVREVSAELQELGRLLQSSALMDQAGRWQRVEASRRAAQDLASLPVVEWLRPLQGSERRLLYLIWHRPWMAVSALTFIGSVLDHLGFGAAVPDFEKPYPEVALEQFVPRDTVLLAATEPFPFARQRHVLDDLPHATALVDGEAFGWFGVRTLAFLEQELGVGREE